MKLLSPNPSTLPPTVEVVLNQASAVKASGATMEGELIALLLVVPLNVEAVLESPAMAPDAPRSTPDPAVRADQPAQSTTVEPLDSPRRQ